MLKEQLKKHKEEAHEKEQFLKIRLKRKIVEVFSLIKQLQKAQEEIEKATKTIDEQTIQLHKRQEEVEGLRDEVVGLNGEMERLQMKQRMNEGFKKSTEVLNDILSQQRFPCEKSSLGFCIIQKLESKTLKLSEEEA